MSASSSAAAREATSLDPAILPIGLTKGLSSFLGRAIHGKRYGQPPYFGFALPVSANSSLNSRLLSAPPEQRTEFLTQFLSVWTAACDDLSSRQALISLLGSKEKDAQFLSGILGKPLEVVQLEDGCQIRCGCRINDDVVQHLFSIKGGLGTEDCVTKAGRLIGVVTLFEFLGYQVLPVRKWPQWNGQRQCCKH